MSLFGHPVVMLSSLAAINDFRAASPENFSHRLTNIVENLRQGKFENSPINIEGANSSGEKITWFSSLSDLVTQAPHVHNTG